MEKREMFKSPKLIIALLAILCSTNLFAQQWITKYQSRIMGDLIGDNKAFAIKAGNEGNVFVTGFCQNMGTDYDMSVIAYGPGGDTLWTRFYNDTIANSEDKAYAITIDKQWNIIVTGFSTTANMKTHITTIKYSSAGNQDWVAIYQPAVNSNSKAYAITLDANDNIYVTGFADTAGKPAYITIKYNPAGQQQWANYYTKGFGDTATSISMINDSYLAITGTSLQNSSGRNIIATVLYNTSGTQVWFKRFYTDHVGKGKAISADNYGNIYVTGYLVNSDAIPNKDIALIKYSLSGDEVWSRLYNRAGFDDIGSSVSILDSNIIVTGTSQSGSSILTEDYITLKYSTNGNLGWVKIYNGPGNNMDISRKAVISPTENAVYITGSSKCDSAAGSEDMMTIEYDITNGTIVDSARISTSPTNIDVAYDLTVDSASNVYVTGYSLPVSGGNSFSLGATMMTVKFGSGHLGARIHKNTNKPNNSPVSFMLYQNYPNPFNPSTNIKFDIAKSLDVKLIIYDIIGQQVQTLVNGKLNAGYYSIPFNNNSLASGVYFYELSAGNFRDIKKMVLIK